MNGNQQIKSDEISEKEFKELARIFDANLERLGG